MTGKYHVPKLRRSSGDRLANALETLAHRHGDSPQMITVTELCRLADVSRNSLYRYHGTSLNALRKLQRRRVTLADSKIRKSDEQRRVENVALRERISKLAALVDHYYTAYQETNALLQRRELELAALHRRLKVQPTLVKS